MAEKEIKKKASTAKKEKKEEKMKKAEKTPQKKKATEKKEVKEKVVSKGKENYPIRGNIFDGEVISAKSQRTITVQRQLTHYISKYERYKKVFSKIKAHVPEGMEVKEGDKVRVGETRKISKTKTFVVMKILGAKK